jgi:peptidoglycan/xylan/chitin deacetylase (PgdA/CDA1 family)
MSDLDSVLAANRAAVDDLLTAAEHTGHMWTTPRAPGKWSPAEVAEHVARSLEEAANVISGRPTKLPTLPRLIRPVAGFMLRRIVRSGKFPKAKTNRAMNPARSGPALASPAEARTRLHTALATFEREARARVAAGRPVESTAFGVVSVEDYARFTELHTRHHTKQIPIAL